jgi:hypothetical protein
MCGKIWVLVGAVTLPALGEDVKLYAQTGEKIAWRSGDLIRVVYCSW